MKKCTFCGAKNKDSSRYCSECGTRLDTDHDYSGGGLHQDEENLQDEEGKLGQEDRGEENFAPEKEEERSDDERASDHRTQEEPSQERKEERTEIYRDDLESAAEKFREFMTGLGSSDRSGYTGADDESGYYSELEKRDGKLMSVLAYLGVLIVIPILAHRGNRFVKFHVNQGLVILLVRFGISLIIQVSQMVALQDFFGPMMAFSLIRTAFRLLHILLFMCAVFGIINAVQGKAVRVPVIGSLNLYH